MQCTNVLSRPALAPDNYYSNDNNNNNKIYLGVQHSRSHAFRDFLLAIFVRHDNNNII